MSRAAVVGLGRMGGAMATRLARSGVDTVVWNRGAARAAALAQHGVAVADSPLAAARDADLVLVSVADAAAQQEVLFGTGGVLSDGPLAAVLACTSTVTPADIEAIQHRGPATGLLDIGLLGNHDHALTGRLRLYIGGGTTELDRVRPLLDLLAQQVLHVGPLGSGMRLKLLMNLLMGVQVQAMAEAVAYGVAAGLDRQQVLDAITVSGFATPVMGFKAKRIASRRYGEADFRLRLMAKDLELVLREATGAGVELPATEAAYRLHALAVEKGLGDEDCAAIARMVEPEPDHEPVGAP